MYIQSIFKQVNGPKVAKEYRDELKNICKLNLRRNSKFNLMSILGALKTFKDVNYKDSLSIYIASEYGCVEDLLKVLEQINSEDSMLMPFDFLNVNTNNTGFLVAQALNTFGNNINITSEDFSFEKAFELAYFDFNTKDVKEILIGGVDESVEEIINHNSIIHNLENAISKDGSSWLYINDKKENSIAMVKAFEFFTNLEEAFPSFVVKSIIKTSSTKPNPFWDIFNFPKTSFIFLFLKLMSSVFFNVNNFEGNSSEICLNLTLKTSPT